MSYHRLAYDDAATTAEMASDARRAGDALRLPDQARGREDADDAAAPGSPVVSDDLARMAADLELHLD